MADLALALTKPSAAAALAATLTVTPAKGAAPAGAADPFAILMAAAAPAAPKTPVTVAPVDEPALPDVAEKTGDGETAKKDGDKPSDPDALLALLTPSAPISQPIAAVAPSTPVSDTPDPAPAAKAVTQIVLPNVLPPISAGDAPDSAPAAQRVAQIVLSQTPVSDTPDPAPAAKTVTQIMRSNTLSQTAAPAIDPPPPPPPGAAAALATQASVHALVQAMSAPADPASAPQPLVSKPAAQGIAPVAARDVETPVIAASVAPARDGNPPTAVASTAPLRATQTPATPTTPAMIAQAAPAIPDLQVKPIARGTRFIAPKLEDVRAAAKGGVPAARTATPAGRTETAEAKPQQRETRHAKDSASPNPALPQSQAQEASTPARDVTAAVKPLEAGSVDAVVNRHLAIARDGQWLDSLAKDIAATGGNTSSLSFTLSPENLGNLKVDITNGSDGASVHMTTDTDTARSIILDAQPRLAAEARAQGLTLKETSVATNSDSQRQAQSQQQASSQSSGQQPDQHRRAFAQTASQQPLAPTLTSSADKESDGELYA